MLKSIGIGIGAALLIFGQYNGINVLPVVMFALIAYFAFRTIDVKGKKNYAVAGGSTGRVKEISFTDIGGQESAKKELQEALEFMRNLEKIKELGIRPLKGILLNGPPGTGKTLLAKAAASFVDSVFIATSGSEFVEMYVGVGAQRVRQVFREARAMAKKQQKKSAIIFIDEIDVLGGKRGQNSSHLEYDQTLNQLLVEMDGVTANDEIQVLVMGATNRVDLLDAALLRPGRFDRIVRVDLPDKEGREHILGIHTRNKPMANDVELAQVAKETFGFSGAHLESLANEAAIMAMREDDNEIRMKHLREAIDKVMLGEKLDRKPALDELRRVAIHEVGHALLSEKISLGSVSTITITPRGKALGYMRQSPQDDINLYTQDYLEGQISVLLAGAVAEKVICGNSSTGASNDFSEAIRLAKQIIVSGMSGLGIVDIEQMPKEILHETIQKILATIEQNVKREIESKAHLIKDISKKLLEEEKIQGDEFRKIIGLAA